jgi:hypothetical protein
LVVLGGIAYWALTQMDNPPIAMGRAAATPTPVPTATPLPTTTPQPGIGISIPGPQGTPTNVTIPLPIPGLGAQPGSSPSLPTITLPTITIPTISIPGASGTPVPGAKLTADGAREKVKDSLSNCQLLQAQISLSQVTFEAPVWHVRLPLTGATWDVDDNTGAVTPDERAAERARTCRL